METRNFGRALSIAPLGGGGWHVEIDLHDTALAGLVVPFSRDVRERADWIEVEVSAGRYIASGGRANLNELLGRFLALAGEHGGGEGRD